MDSELTKEEKLLLEEYKIGWDAYYRSEAIYTSWERFFALAEGIIVAITAQLLLSETSILWFVAFLLGILGIIMTLFWFLIQARDFRFSEARGLRLKEIENLMSRPSKEDPKIMVFAFYNEYIKILEKRATKWYETQSTWLLRKIIPILFIVVWIIICVLSILRYFNIAAIL